MTKLTAKQELFCQEYQLDRNATEAARRAGYSDKTAKSIGSENLTKPDIAGRLIELTKDRSEKTLIDAEWVLKAAKDVYDRCMQYSPIMAKDGSHVQDEDGNNLFKFEPASANKALEIIGKHVDIQAFKERVEIDLAVSSADAWSGEDE